MKGSASRHTNNQLILVTAMENVTQLQKIHRAMKRKKDDNTEQNRNEIRQTGTNGEEEAFFMDKTVNHTVHHDKTHKQALIGENMYRVRWYGYLRSNDT